MASVTAGSTDGGINTQTPASCSRAFGQAISSALSRSASLSARTTTRPRRTISSQSMPLAAAIELRLDTAHEFGDAIPEPKGRRLMYA